MSIKDLIFLMALLSSASFGNWYDGTDSEFEPYVQSYKALNKPNKYRLGFIRHERPNAAPQTFQCRLVTTGALRGLLPVASSVSVFVNKAYFSIQTDKQTFVDELLDKCLNAVY